MDVYAPVPQCAEDTQEAVNDPQERSLECVVDVYPLPPLSNIYMIGYTSTVLITRSTNNS